MITVLENSRIEKCKRAFVTRNIPQPQLRLLSSHSQQPKAGDLLMARVISIGNHKRLELTDGRRAELYQGDEIIVAYGNRYAPDQYEAELPTNLDQCDLVAAGGIASKALSWSSKITAPTRIEPIGMLVDAQHHPINLADYALNVTTNGPRPNVIGVVGCAMNAGKTTTAANLIRGFVQQGHKVGAAKLTGTGAGGDIWKMRDAGADMVLDFTDAGFATTFMASLEALQRAAEQLIAKLSDSGCSVIVVEIADGIYQQETSLLVRSKTIKSLVDGYLYAANGATSAVTGVQWLQQYGKVFAISGVVSASPLACREAEAITGIPCLTIQQLSLGNLQNQWLESSNLAIRHDEIA